MLIDVHGHIGRILPDRREFIDVTNLIAKMDAWGIDKTCVLPLSEHPEGAYLECNTEDVITACSHYPARLIPFCLIDPRYGNKLDMDFSHLLEEYTERGCKGLGEFQDKLMFGTDSCSRSDVNNIYPNVAFVRNLRETKHISDEALDKIEYNNALQLLNLNLTEGGNS